MRDMEETSQSGFTLVELIVTVAIIGLIAAIAIPEFSSYRKKVYDAVAQSDLKNLIIAYEAYRAEHDVYHWSSAPPGFTASKGVITETNHYVDPISMDLGSCHLKGARVYRYASNGPNAGRITSVNIADTNSCDEEEEECNCGNITW